MADSTVFNPIQSAPISNRVSDIWNLDNRKYQSFNPDQETPSAIRSHGVIKQKKTQLTDVELELKIKSMEQSILRKEEEAKRNMILAFIAGVVIAFLIFKAMKK